MTTRRRILTGIATLAALAAAPLPTWAAGEKLTVVATTGMIADTARRIGGDLAEVRALMGPGVDPHAYRQTRTDIVAMARADLVLWNGLFLEAQMEDVLGDIASRTTVRAVAQAVPQEKLVAHDDYADRFDPHVWMDPALWRDVAIDVRDTMIELAPENAETYTSNADAFLADIDALLIYSSEALASVPEEARVLITAHDAFNYFGSAYGFEVIGIQGISTESEAGLNRISTLVDLLVERALPAVFVETSVSDRNIRALIEGSAAQGHTVTIGGALFSDAMGPEGTYEGTWLGMIDHNVTTIARALGADVPATGRLGRLKGAA